ncbi:hypothetical protein LY39_02630 [Roseinatronobacter bogoriensis subsp. barguzinensis]|nr:hypothetical protein LY39_02630 [Rhodobaca barguzinensis]
MDKGDGGRLPPGICGLRPQLSPPPQRGASPPLGNPLEYFWQENVGGQVYAGLSNRPLKARLMT